MWSYTPCRGLADREHGDTREALLFAARQMARRNSAIMVADGLLGIMDVIGD